MPLFCVSWLLPNCSGVSIVNESCKIFLLPWQSSYSAMRKVACSLHLSQSYFAAHISSMWTRWISHFGCTKIGKQKICVTCERKKQIWDLFFFISLRCVSALFACFSLFWGKFAWNSYRFTFKQNNCTKASVTSPPPSVCLLMPRVVSKTKAVQKKADRGYSTWGEESMAPAKICVLLEKWIAFKQWKKQEKERIDRQMEWRK